MRCVRGLAELAEHYDGFIVDLWGVVHDGVAPFPAALACLAALRGKTVLLLSNAPRRAWAARDALQRLGVDDGLYSELLTSGEATWLALRDRIDPWFCGLGNRVYHLGPARDESVMEGLGLVRVGAPGEAEFVLNTGPDDQRDGERLESFSVELNACLDHRLPMLCANPDFDIVRGVVRILCAGALAAYYAAHGGDVRWVGKPDAAIYEQALRMMKLGPRQILAVGDSLRTDITGAARAGIDAVWVLGGVHASDIQDSWERAEEEVRRAGLRPVAAIAALAW